MCDFEDIDIISRYTRTQAVDDGVLVQVLSWNGKPVLATAHLSDKLGVDVLLDIWGRNTCNLRHIWNQFGAERMERNG